MMESSGTALAPVHLYAAWGLNLTAQRRKPLLGCRLLRLVAPFLALGGRYWPQAVAARSPGLLTAMPWLAPRWLERPEREASPAHANEPVMGPLMAAAPAGASPPVRTPRQQQGQPLMALALAAPFAGNLRRWAPSSPSPAEPVGHLARTKKETAKMGGVFPHTYILPQVLPYRAGTAGQRDNLPVPDSKATDEQTAAGARGEEAGSPPGFGSSSGSMPWRLPNMAPLGRPPGGFRGLTPGTSPAAFYRIMVPAAPGHRAEQAELLFGSRPEAAAPRERPPLPEHKLPGGLQTVAPGPVSLQGLSLVLETIRHTMKGEVAAAIREREEEAQSLASNPANGIDPAAAENLVSDNLVRLFMQKMRKLAEEERFRLGLLR